MQEFFAELGLNPNKEYTPDDLKKAYRDLSKVHHPDKGGDKEKFQKLNHAYQMLTDPSYRRDNTKVGVNLNFDMQVPISFEDAFFGKQIVVTYNRLEVAGDKTLLVKSKLDLVSFVVNYPIGVLAGYQHLEKGGGIQFGEVFGDCCVTFLVKQHPKFQTDGANIITQEAVDLEVMLKGGLINVQTLYGIKEVKVRPGSHPGQRINIFGHGVRKSHAHVAVLQPVFPTKEDLKAKKKFNKLDINWKEFDEPEPAPPNPFAGFNIYTSTF